MKASGGIGGWPWNYSAHEKIIRGDTMDRTLVLIRRAHQGDKRQEIFCLRKYRTDIQCGKAFSGTWGGDGGSVPNPAASDF